ncbi:hypothetical protein EON66_04785 [archaeon]|nr:MAG: hypothetical protein EON66_04785 [archaeon]
MGSFHANVTEDAVAFAMGCAEAAATWPFMNAYWSNYEANEYGAAGPSPALRNFMSAQLAWARAGVASWKQAQLAKQASLPKMKSLRALGDKFWGGMAMLLSQFDGLVYYYNTFVPAAQRLDEIDLYMLNSVGDLEDLDQQFPNKVAGARFVGATAAARAELHASTSRRPATEVRASLLRDDMPLRDKMVDCSALIRLLPDLSDVLVGHTTWRMYYAMLRVYKMYQMPFTNAGWVSFSSSPGLLHSKVRNTCEVETVQAPAVASGLVFTCVRACVCVCMCARARACAG